MAANDSALQTGSEKIATNALNTVNGTNVTADLIEAQRMKMGWGADGVLNDVSATAPMPFAAYDQAGHPISSIADGGGFYALLMATGATNFFFSTLNTSAVQLAASAVFTGTIETAASQPSISFLLTSDQPTTLTIKQYIDAGGTRAVPSIVKTIAAGIGISGSFPLNGNYVQVTAQNTGASTTTTFSLNVAYGNIPVANSAGNVPVDMATVGGSAVALGQNTMAASLPVVLANNQTAVPVTQATLIKGTQGATGITVQALNDAGRNLLTFYTVIPVLATATDTLQSLTGTKSGATVTATTTPAVVTTGKTFRVTGFAATYIATATSGYALARLRFNTAGVVAITSPVAATLAVAAGTPATANSGASEDAGIAEGTEFAAGTGIGISVQGFSAATATAVGYMFVSVSGYEY